VTNLIGFSRNDTMISPAWQPVIYEARRFDRRWHPTIPRKATDVPDTLFVRMVDDSESPLNVGVLLVDLEYEFTGASAYTSDLSGLKTSNKFTLDANGIKTATVTQPMFGVVTSSTVPAADIGSSLVRLRSLHQRPPMM